MRVAPLLLLAGLFACKPDADGDGYKEGEDCNDADASVLPGAPELCNGVDDDCDGVIDPDAATDATTFFADSDGDGFGDRDDSTQACAAPDGYVADATDCDDANGATYPSANEVCGDGIENDCATDGRFDCEAIECTGDPACAPTLLSVTPDHGYEGVATAVTITANGIDTKTAGLSTVTFGAAGECSSLTYVDATTITCYTPPGEAGTVDVTLTTDNGSDTLSLAYTFDPSPIYAADGKGATSGSLYQIDADTGAVTTIGAIGFGVTAMAFAPDGTLYAITATRGVGSQLITIDTDIGAGSVVATITGVEWTSMPDMTFVGSRLIAWSENDDAPYEVDTATGAVTRIGTESINSGGSGLAYDGAKVWFVPYGGEEIYTIDPTTGDGTSTGVTLDAEHGTFNAMTFHQGTMFVVDAWNSRSGGPSTLKTVDPTTGALTKVADLSDGVDAIASRTP